MKRFKKWLYSKFLPDYCRLSSLATIAKLEHENRELKIYIRGLENARQKITIRNEVKP